MMICVKANAREGGLGGFQSGGKADPACWRSRVPKRPDEERCLMTLSDMAGIRAFEKRIGRLLSQPQISCLRLTRRHDLSAKQKGS